MHAGVNEYWIIDPEHKKVYANQLNDGEYELMEYSNADTIPVQVLSGFGIDLSVVFTD